MNRRDAIQHISLLLGGTIIGSNAFLTGCKTSTGNLKKFTEEDIAYLDEIADTILPTTAASPGAKAAAVGTFMTVMVKDCYEEKDQKIFTEGMQKLQDASKKKNGKYFMESTPQQRHDLLVELDKEQRDYTKNKKADDSNHYFRMMKELTLLGYFTSEIGATKALRYIESPGKWEACVPYKKGDKAWAT
jgi:hypothetical protein